MPAERETAEAAIGVAMAAQGDLAGGLARVRGLDDDQTRVHAFRRIAETQARSLDGWKALSGAPAPANATPPAIVAHDAVYEDKTLTVGPTPAKMITGIAGVPMPSFAVTAADVRMRMPLPTTAGDADVTPIRYNQFNDKFLEEAARTVGQPILVGLQRDLNPFYINLDRGVFTLGDVYRKLLAAGQTTAIVRVGEGYLVRLPILVGPEATLILGGEDVDEVRLSSDTGAFLVVAGTLYAVDTRIVAYSEANGGPDLRKDAEGKVFRPFVAAWSDSEMHIAGSTLIGLGYPAGKAYGLSFTAGPVSLVRVRSAPKPPTGTVVENTFINNLYGFYSYEAAGVEIIGNEYRDNIVYGVDPHDRSHDLRIAYNTLYGTLKKHGLIVSREVDESFLVGNIAFDNAGSGIMLDRDSVSNTIYANSSINNAQDGLTFFESSCNVVMSNLFADNARSGVRIRNSWDIGLFGNTIRANKRGGIDAYVSDLAASVGSEARDFVLDPYTPLVTFHSEGDQIDGNGAAVTTRGITAMTIAEDSFTHHGNKIIRGDFAPVSTQIVQYSGRGGVRAMSTCRPKKPEMACKLRTLGLLPADDSLVIFDPAGDATCTGVEGSLQKAAFAPDPEEATR